MTRRTWPVAPGLVLGLLLAGCDSGVGPAAGVDGPAQRRPLPAAAGASEAAAGASTGTLGRSAGDELPVGFAFETIELATGRVLQSARAEQLDVAISPGSVAKVFATSAAVDAGALSLDTTLACPRVVLAEGRRVDCVHPDLGHPLDVSEALAHSCNAFFVSVARRLPRAAFNRALVESGAPPADPSAPMVLALLGLDGVRASARVWRRAFVDVVARAQAAPDSPAHRALLAGLGRAALEGTAAAFGARGLRALAKTGTAVLGGDQPGGLVVAVLPAEQPTIAVVALAAGGAGRDAAVLAAERVSLLPRELWPTEVAAPSVATPQATGGAASMQTGERRPRSERAHQGPAVSIEGTSTAPDGALTTAASLVSSLPVRVGSSSGGAAKIVSMPLEQYVASVVAAEAPIPASPALLQALAVLARSFALAHWGRHGQEGYDFCDTTHCQVVGRPTAISQAAAAATVARVLANATDVARAYYSAACGGNLAAPSSVWHGDDRRSEGGLVGPEPVPHDHEPWTSELSRTQLEAVLRTMGLRGAGLRSIEAREASPAGRVTAIHVEGLSPTEIDAEQFRLTVGRQLGWHLLKSSNYTVEPTASGARFHGRGKGHGVGLCVAGAAVLAKSSATHTRLLSTYFPGLEVVSLETALSSGVPGGEPAVRAIEDAVVVNVPRSHEAERTAVERRLRRALPALRARLGRAQPLSIRLRFHPTRESFGRATGQPWWISASQHVSGNARVVDLLPLELLERRGDLEDVLNHELVHALTADVLGKRPRWVQEGVARHFASEDVGTGIDAVTPLPRGGVVDACPGDAAFQDARTPDDLATAYRRAAVCVRNALSRGVDWRSIGEAARAPS